MGQRDSAPRRAGQDWSSEMGRGESHSASARGLRWAELEDAGHCPWAGRPQGLLVFASWLWLGASGLCLSRALWVRGASCTGAVLLKSILATRPPRRSALDPSQTEALMPWEWELMAQSCYAANLGETNGSAAFIFPKRERTGKIADTKIDISG